MTPPRPTALTLTAEETDMLHGGQGDAIAMAMRLVVSLARTLGASSLIAISSAHIDSCLYHGRASLDFALRLVALGAQVRVPTTLNVGSVDLLHPGRVRSDKMEEQATLVEIRKLMDAYAALGCRPTWTCAPYQLSDRPALGEHIAWAESNAIVFANSVLGAGTDRYGDFLDIAAAIAGRAPYAGLHQDKNRRGHVVIDCTQVPDAMLCTDLAYPLLGYIAGTAAGTNNPVLVGLPAGTSENRRKALGAAAASSGGVALFHAVGITPEAPTLQAAQQGQPALTTIKLTAGRPGSRPPRALHHHRGNPGRGQPRHTSRLASPYECRQLVDELGRASPSIPGWPCISPPAAPFWTTSGPTAPLTSWRDTVSDSSSIPARTSPRSSPPGHALS